MTTATLHANQTDRTRIVISPIREVTCSLLATTGLTALTLGAEFVAGFSIWSTPVANWVLVGIGKGVGPAGMGAVSLVPEAIKA